MNQNEQQILTRALFCHAAHSGSLSEAASPHLAGLIEEMQELFRVNPDLEPSV